MDGLLGVALLLIVFVTSLAIGGLERRIKALELKLGESFPPLSKPVMPVPAPPEAPHWKLGKKEKPKS